VTSRALALPTLLALASCSGGGASRCIVAPAASLPLVVDAGHIDTDVILNGQTVRMVVDTGASMTAVSRATAEQLRLDTRGAGVATGIGGNSGVSLFYTTRFQIGRLSGGRFPLAVGDFALPNGVNGLLGVDFLSSYDVDLDLIGGRVNLAAVSGCAPKAQFLPGKLYQVPLVDYGDKTIRRTTDLRPRVAVRIGGHFLTALIDTGSPGTLIFRDAASVAGLGADATDSDFVSTRRGVGHGSVKAMVVRTPSMSFGEVALHNMPVTVVDQHSAGDHIDMIIGMDILARMHAWISFSTNTLVLQYPPAATP